MSTKHSIHTTDGQIFEVEDNDILCNHVVLPWEFNPHSVGLYIIGHTFGVVACVWAECESDALDELMDHGRADCFLIKDKDYDEQEVSFLGNAGEPCNINDAWIQRVEFKPERDYKLLCAFAEARGADYTSLEK